MNNNNVLEELLIDCGCDLNNIDSCLVIAPSYYSQFTCVGNILVEYYNLPHEEDEFLLPDGDMCEMEDVIDDISNYVSGREFDAVIFITTDEIEEEYSARFKIGSNFTVKKYDITYYADTEMVSVDNVIINYNRLEKMLIECGCSAKSINDTNSCLLIAPSDYSDIKKFGNAEVEYYNIPNSAEELEGGENEMRRKLAEIINSVYKRIFDAVIVISTDEIYDKYNLSFEISKYVGVDKCGAYWHTDSNDIRIVTYEC